MLRVVVKADFVCEGVCLQPGSYTCWRNFHMEKEFKKKKRPLRYQKGLWSYPTQWESSVFFKDLSVYHFRKVLKSPLGNSLYLDFFFFLLLKQKSLIYWHIWVRIYYPKKVKFLYYDLCHLFKKMYTTIQISLHIAH